MQTAATHGPAERAWEIMHHGNKRNTSSSIAHPHFDQSTVHNKKTAKHADATQRVHVYQSTLLSH
jgi:hypothetical protein